METKKSKLHLRKEVVARLNSIEMTILHGGGVIFPTDAAATCFSPTNDNDNLCNTDVCFETTPNTKCQCPPPETVLCGSSKCLNPDDTGVVCHVESGYDFRDTCTCPIIGKTTPCRTNTNVACN